MTLFTFLVAVAAVVVVITAYFYSMRRLLELPLTGIELHPFYTPDGWRIMLYRHRRGDSNGEPVLLVHGYSSNHWNLTAPRGASVADYLADAGYDCWAIDLRGTRSSSPPPGTPRHRATFDGYVMEDLPGALDYIRKVTGHDQAHWVGHSLGGTLLYAYELVHGGSRVASGTTIGSPPSLRLTAPSWQSHLIGLLEAAPGAFAFVQRGLAPFHALFRVKTRMIPVDWDNLSPKFGVAEFFSAVETPPGPVTRTLDECAKHRYLAVDSDRVNVLAGLNRLEIPLLVFGCPLDPIVPVPVLHEFFDRLPSRDKKYIELSCEEGCERDYDHIDPPFAKNGPAEVYSPIVEWMRAHPVREVELPAPAVAAAPIPATALVAPREQRPVPVEEIRVSAPAPAGSPSVQVEPRPAAPLWGRALKDAADMLDGLGSDAVGEADAAPVKQRSKRRGAAVAAKRKSTKQRASKPKRTTSSRVKAAEKPPAATASQTNNKPKARTKKKAKASSKSKSKKADAEARKKNKKKRDKSKDKSARKKSKRKKASRK